MIQFLIRTVCNRTIWVWGFSESDALERFEDHNAIHGYRRVVKSIEYADSVADRETRGNHIKAANAMADFFSRETE